MKTIELEMTDKQFYDLANFLKRLTYDQISINSVSAGEAEEIKDSIYSLQKALADNGFNPR